jgi:ParB family transcriptional regulator, chromosome partitioning protein
MAENRQVSIMEKLATKLTRAEQIRTSGTPGTDSVAPYAAEATQDAVLASILPGQQLRSVRLDLLLPAPEGQARQDFDEERLRTLADSLRRSGVREPIIVTPDGAEPGHFQIVAGERRWRAARLAGLEAIPCIVDPTLVGRGEKLLAQAEENLHRENLNPAEEAAVLAQLMEARQLDVRKAGELMGRSYIQARRLHRLHTAVEPIKNAVRHGDLDARAAVEVIRIYNTLAQKDFSPELRESVARIEGLIERIVREKWSARRIEQYATKLGAGGGEDEADAAGSSTPPTLPKARQKPAARQLAEAPDVKPEVSVSEEPVAQPPAPVLLRRDGRVVIEETRIHRGGLTPEEREELIAVLEELLMRVRRA